MNEIPTYNCFNELVMANCTNVSQMAGFAVLTNMSPDVGTFESMTGKQYELYIRKSPQHPNLVQVGATEVLDADGQPSHRRSFDIQGWLFPDEQTARLRVASLRKGASWDTGEPVTFQNPQF